MKKLIFVYLLLIINNFPQKEQTQNPPIYIAFLWHMHQPIYWPYESIVQTQLNNRYPYSVFDIHNSRTGPYTSWPKNAVQKGISAGLPNFGAQVSFSGSLIENLNNLEAYGNNNFSNWKSNWNSIKTQNTMLGNPRLDMVAFGYFHPLMGLIDYNDIRKQIQMHKQIFAQNFSGNYSKGIFPPENAFATRMIPALVDEGINWVLVDNIHFDRAAAGYPFSTSGNIYEPNKSDVVNPNPNDWIQLNGLWAPTKNSARWGRQPHWVEYVDPSTGQKKKIIAVPADRYMGNEDGRGGFGALNYEAVMSQLEPYNTDPNHPILIVLHHDGDNYGGGTDSYYGSNFQNFVNWLVANPTRFKCTTIEDYLQMFPPDPNDIIHVEPGSWSGADNGDPEFKKWLGDPDASGYSPDINSWGVMTAAKNFVETANQINASNSNTVNAWKYYLVGQSSDYWYWDGSMNGIWDSHPTRAANQAITFAQSVISGGNDITPPTIFLPQREPYNPGATEWGINQPANFTVWTYVYDISGLKSVTLKYRIDDDGENSPFNIDNETYAGGPDVGPWNDIPMLSISRPSNTNPQPLKKAKEFYAMIDGMNEKYLDYYVEAIDSNNIIARSPIQHVWVGEFSGGGGGSGNQVIWSPANATNNDSILITVRNIHKPGKLHWGVNNSGNQWQTPNQVYWTDSTVLFNGTGPAVESPFTYPDSAGNISIKIGPFNNPIQHVERIAFVIHYNDNTWDNNNGQDYHINLSGGSGGQLFIMDGILDAGVQTVSSNGNVSLYLGWNGAELYVATQSAQSQGNDVFIFISDSLRPLVQAPWAKSGQVSNWSLFLGNESTNNWAGWFDQNSASQKAAGSILEGVINVQNEFGYVPNKIFIAVGQYQTQDGGTLLKQVPNGNGDGNINQNEFYEFDYSITSANEVNLNISDFKLYQNYPNPFNPITKIKFSIPNVVEAYHASINSAIVGVVLQIYDVLGNNIATLVNEYRRPGNYEVLWDASGFPSGVYFYQLRIGGYIETKKMVLMK